MNDTQRKIAALMAFAMLVSVCLFLIACAYSVISGRITGASGLGWWYLSFMRNADEIRTVFAAPILIIASSITILGSYSSYKTLVIVNSIIASLGIAAAFLLYILLKDEEGYARPLWYTSSPPMSPEEVASGTVLLLGYLVAWLSSQLVAQLGLPTKMADAAQASVSQVRSWFHPSPPPVEPEVGKTGKGSK